MKNFIRKSVGYAILLICLTAYSAVSYAAGANAPKNQIAPDIKGKVEKVLKALGTEITRKEPVDAKSAFALLTAHLSKNSYIYGAAFAFAPAEKSGKLVKTSPYVYRSGGKLIEKDLIDSYDYTVQDWYVVPVKAGKPVWSSPYYDEGGGDAWMITYSIPIYSGGKRPQLIGVLTSDLLIPSE
jgi:sigma-B regulation protein RsbU (phosphoserine phosphatase)